MMSHCSGPVQVEERSCMKISPSSTLTPIAWEVMNIINDVAEGTLLHVHLSQQVWTQRSERCGRAAPANVACAEYTQNIHCWGKMSGLIKNSSTKFLNRQACNLGKPNAHAQQPASGRTWVAILFQKARTSYRTDRT